MLQKYVVQFFQIIENDELILIDYRLTIDFMALNKFFF